MASLNKIMLVGRLANDPQTRYTASGLAVSSFTVAVDRPFGKGENGDKKTDFFRCKAWRQKAEFVSQYLTKGRLVLIEGRVELNEFTDQEGQKRYITEVVVDQIEGLDSRDRAGEAAPGQRGGYEDDNAGTYFPDEEPAPARAAQRPAPQVAPAQRSSAPMGNGGGQRQAPAQSAPPQRQAPRPAPARPAYPADDDYDDSDPFADE